MRLYKFATECFVTYLIFFEIRTLTLKVTTRDAARYLIVQRMKKIRNLSDVILRRLKQRIHLIVKKIMSALILQKLKPFSSRHNETNKVNVYEHSKSSRLTLTCNNTKRRKYSLCDI